MVDIATWITVGILGLGAPAVFLWSLHDLMRGDTTDGSKQKVGRAGDLDPEVKEPQ
jgi:hypothetical protein